MTKYLILISSNNSFHTYKFTLFKFYAFFSLVRLNNKNTPLVIRNKKIFSELVDCYIITEQIVLKQKPQASLGFFINST
jgi:hypothetical protein